MARATEPVLSRTNAPNRIEPRGVHLGAGEPLRAAPARDAATDARGGDVGEKLIDQCRLSYARLAADAREPSLSLHDLVPHRIGSR